VRGRKKGLGEGSLRAKVRDPLEETGSQRGGRGAGEDGVLR